MCLLMCVQLYCGQRISIFMFLSKSSIPFFFFLWKHQIIVLYLHFWDSFTSKFMQKFYIDSVKVSDSIQISSLFKFYTCSIAAAFWSTKNRTFYKNVKEIVSLLLIISNTHKIGGHVLFKMEIFKLLYWTESCLF